MPHGRDIVNEDKLVESFLASRANEQTRTSYEQALGQLRTWASARELQLLELERTDLERFLRDKGGGWAPSTRGHKIGALTAFYTYATSLQLVGGSPLDGIERPKLDHRRDPSGLTLQDFQAILTATESMADRHAVAVLLILIGGFRVSEVTGLKVGDVRFDGDLVAITLPKPERTVVLPPVIGKRIKPLVEGRRDGPLLLTSAGKGFERHLLGDTVERTGRRAGLKKHLTPMNLQTLMFETALSSGVAPWELAKAVGARDFRSFGKLTPETGTIDPHPSFRIIRRLSDAPALNDLRHQVDVLLSEPNVHPVAPIVVAGAVLESRLRAMAHEAGVVPSGKPGISSYATALRRAKVITEAERKEVELLGDWRNRAAHGDDLDGLKPVDAERMADGVKFFLERHG